MTVSIPYRNLPAHAPLARPTATQWLVPVDLHASARPLARLSPRDPQHIPIQHSDSFFDRISLLGLALIVSVGVHLVVLAVHFITPDTFRLKSTGSKLDVILVNAHSQVPPAQETALAQADLNGGGEHEEGRTTSFLPNSGTITDGDALKETTRATNPTDAEQNNVMTQLKPALTAVDPDSAVRKILEEPTKALDLTDSVRAVARMEAQIEKRIEDYSVRPRRGFIGPSTRGISYAMYYSQWKDKVERVGTVNFPEAARGKTYGDLMLTVTLNPDGSIYKNQVVVTQSSGYEILDRAAVRIVRLAAPYGQFSEEMKKDYDIFEIITKFSFTRSDGVEAVVQR